MGRSPSEADAVARVLSPDEAAAVLSMSRVKPMRAADMSFPVVEALHKAGIAFFAINYVTLTIFGAQVQDRLRKAPA